MASYQTFIPGGNTNSRINCVQYFEKHNSRDCLKPIPNKSILGTGSASGGVSYKMRLSNMIQYAQGKKTHYGNGYLGQSININYLGKAEGMPGGSGRPISNF
jgi:hypothetical protein